MRTMHHLFHLGLLLAVLYGMLYFAWGSLHLPPTPIFPEPAITEPSPNV